MGNTCAPATPLRPHTTLLRNFTHYTETPEFILYKKLHPGAADPINPRDILQALHLDTLCVRTTLTLPKGTHTLSAETIGDGLVGIGMRTALPPPCGDPPAETILDPTSLPTPFYRLLADDHELVHGAATGAATGAAAPAAASPTLFVTPTTPSLLFYTQQAVENPAGLTILMETVPLYALKNTQIRLELSHDAEVDFYGVYYPTAILEATRNKKGKLQLQGHGWLYDPTAKQGEIAFFPDLPF